MAGTKRAAEDEATGPTTRSAKAPKTESPKTRKGGKRGPKATLAASAFKTRALPLHVNITHTPPVLPDADDKDTTTVAHVDPGFIGTTTLVPSTFATGSYGWKGSKRVTIELQNADSADGEKEKVHVMLTINATVMGSKGAKEDVAEDGKEETTEEHAENGANGKEEAHEEADITEAAQEEPEAAQEPEAAAA